MSSMSPRPASESGGLALPVAASTGPARRGRGRGGVSGSGTGKGRGGGAAAARKKRQSTVASDAGTPAYAAGTPGADSAAGTPLPGILSPSTRSGTGFGASTSIRGREGSIASISRRSNTTKGGRTAAGGTDGEDGMAYGEAEEDEDDDEGENELDLLLGDDEYDEQAKERAEAKEALRLLLDQFSPEQLERYEVYRRSGLQKQSVRRLINHILQQSCSPNIIVAVRGLAKVFVGEVVESARQVQTEGHRTGPLTPDDLREAYSRYKSVQDRRGSQRAKLFVR